MHIAVSYSHKNLQHHQNHIAKKIFGGYSAQYYHVNADVLANLQEPEAGDGLDLLLYGR